MNLIPKLMYLNTFYIIISSIKINLIIYFWHITVQFLFYIQYQKDLSFKLIKISETQKTEPVVDGTSFP